MPAERTRKTLSLGQTNAAILRGEDDVSAWDDEELLRGQRRNKNGKWSGKAPTVVPKAIHDEWLNRRMRAAHDLLQESTLDAIQVLKDVMGDPDADAAVRVKAASLIIDRVLGKTPERIDLRADERKPWEDAIVAALVVPSASGVLDVVEADERDDDADEA